MNILYFLILKKNSVPPPVSHNTFSQIVFPFLCVTCVSHVCFSTVNAGTCHVSCFAHLTQIYVYCFFHKINVQLNTNTPTENGEARRTQHKHMSHYKCTYKCWRISPQCKALFNSFNFPSWTSVCCDPATVAVVGFIHMR